MISEIVNALFLTYLATEYLIITNPHHARGQQWTVQQLGKPHNLAAIIGVLICNVVERLLGFSVLFVHTVLHRFLHAPKIVLVAVFYLIALYVDCRRCVSVLPQNKLTLSAFCREVGRGFCYVLPVYPFLAVLISCGFFCALTILDLLNMDATILNWPIYYGTLYGPFSLVYWKVKRRLVEDRSSLPLMSSAPASKGRTLASV